MGLSDRLTSGNDIFCNVMYLLFGTIFFLVAIYLPQKKKEKKERIKTTLHNFVP